MINMMDVLRALFYVLAAYVAYAMVASSLPCLSLFRKRGEEHAPSPFDAADYRGGEGDGPDRIALLESPVDGLGFRLALFENTRETLDLVCHTIHTGPTTSALFSGVVRAADRGVRVRILLDGKASAVRPSVLSMMRRIAAHPNIEIRRYNPAHPLKPWRWHFLMHDKYIISDGRYLLLGGRNIGDKFFAPDDYAGKFSNDRDVVVCRDGDLSGSVLAQAGRYFGDMWAAPVTQPLRPGTAGDLSALHAQADAFARRSPAYFAHSFGEYIARATPTRRVTLLHNPPCARRKAPWIWQQLSRIAMEAEASVTLQTPYITANSGILEGLASVASRVPLSILTNSVASTPNYPAYSNYFVQRRRFLRTGARFYEYQSAHSIHGKAMVVDGRLGILGSFNMDDRSMYLDTEVMLVVDSPAFATELMDCIHAYQVQSTCPGDAPRDRADVARPRVPPYKVPLLCFAAVFSLTLRSFI